MKQIGNKIGNKSFGKNMVRNQKRTSDNKRHSNAITFEPVEARTMMSTVTSLAMPTMLTANSTATTSVTLNWTGGDTLASGFNILRSTDGIQFTKVAAAGGAKTATYTDRTATSGTTYSYEVQEYYGTITSAPSAAATAQTALATPAVSARTTAPATIQITWANKDPLTTGFVINRSTNGGAFSPLTTISSPTTTTFIDTTVSTAASYSYQVQAVNANDKSALSTTTPALTTLFAPTTLTTVMNNGSVQLNWTDNDANATTYGVFRSTDNRTYSQIATLNGASMNSDIDNTANTGTTYYYEVRAFAGTFMSALTAASRVTTPCATPTGLTSQGISATSVVLNWTNNDVNATGYNIYRSTDGVTFTYYNRVSGVATSNFTDTRATVGTHYTYEVNAILGSTVSSVSNASTVHTLVAPTGATAIFNGVFVNLNWTGTDQTATGYLIMRSNDDVNFTQVGQLTGMAASSFADTTATAGQTYYYQVRSTDNNASTSSTVMTVATPVTPATSNVSITTRNGDELVVTEMGADDSVSVTEANSILTINADGQTFTESAPAAGLFIYTRGGTDSINIDQTVSTATTIDSIDGAATAVTSFGKDVIAWVDSTDTLIGNASDHLVASFAGGVTKALGASLANPKDAGTSIAVTKPLFGTGPIAADVNQGSAGDCYFLSSIAGFAQNNPSLIENSVVDLGDGTYGVQYYSFGTPEFVRVSNQFSVGSTGAFRFAHPGTDNNVWAMVMEKAFAYFRTSSNTYSSTNSGWMSEVYSDLNIDSTTFFPSGTAVQLSSQLSSELAAGKVVTLATSSSSPDLVKGHCYLLMSASIDSTGIAHFVVRNPWGISGDKLENSQGLATLTFAQFTSNFFAGVCSL